MLTHTQRRLVNVLLGSFENDLVKPFLNLNGQDEQKKQKIINQHRNTSNTYKNMVNYKEEKNDDILVDIKHLFVLAEK